MIPGTPHVTEAHRVDLVRLRNALQGHLVPTTCIFTLIGVTTIIFDVYTDGDDTQIYRDLRNDAWDILFTWLTMDRSKQHMRAVEDMSCNCGISGVSDPRHSRGVIEFEMAGKQGENVPWTHPRPVLRPARVFLHLALTPLRELWISYPNEQSSTEGLQVPHLREIPSRSQWPLSIKQLLPHGPEATFQGLLIWVPLQNTATIYGQSLRRAISAFVQISAVITLSCASKSSSFSFFDGFLRGSIQFFDEEIQIVMTSKKSFSSDWFSHFIEQFHMIAGAMDHCYIKCMDRRQQARFLSNGVTVSSAFEVFEQAIHVCDQFQKGPLIQAIMPHLHDKSALPRPMNLYKRDAKALEKFKGIFLTICADMYDRFPEVREAVSSDKYARSAIQTHWALHYENPLAHVWYGFLRTLGRFAVVERCWAPRCSKTLGHDIQLRKCGQCSWVLYCSRQCQKRAWIAEYRDKSTSSTQTIAHREICHLIRRLCLQFKVTRPNLERRISSIAIPKLIEKHLSTIEVVTKHFELIAAINSLS